MSNLESTVPERSDEQLGEIQSLVDLSELEEVAAGLQSTLEHVQHHALPSSEPDAISISDQITNINLYLSKRPNEYTARKLANDSKINRSRLLKILERRKEPTIEEMIAIGEAIERYHNRKVVPTVRRYEDLRNRPVPAPRRPDDAVARAVSQAITQNQYRLTETLTAYNDTTTSGLFSTQTV